MSQRGKLFANKQQGPRHFLGSRRIAGSPVRFNAVRGNHNSNQPPAMSGSTMPAILPYESDLLPGYAASYRKWTAWAAANFASHAEAQTPQRRNPLLILCGLCASA